MQLSSPKPKSTDLFLQTVAESPKLHRICRWKITPPFWCSGFPVSCSSAGHRHLSLKSSKNVPPSSEMIMTAAVCGSSISLNRSKLQRVTTFLGGFDFSIHHSWILMLQQIHTNSLKVNVKTFHIPRWFFLVFLLPRGAIDWINQRKQKKNISPWIRPSISDAWNVYPFSSISWLRTMRSTPQFWRNSCVTSWIGQFDQGDKRIFCSIQTRMKEPNGATSRKLCQPRLV